MRICSDECGNCVHTTRKCMTHISAQVSTVLSRHDILCVVGAGCVVVAAVIIMTGVVVVCC